MRASIIIPTFNAADMLPETLLSVLPQLSSDDEVIIIDDGSTDNTKEVLEPYLKTNVRYILQDNSGGPAGPRNVGIQEAKGRYIFLFDSDDLMCPGKVTATLRAFETHPDVGMVFTNFRTIDQSGVLLKPCFLDDYELIKKMRARTSDTGIRIEAPDAYLHLARENFIGTSGVAIPASVLRKLGGFDVALRNGDDRDMWFRITRGYPIVYLSEEYHCYRIRPNSISKGSAEKRVGSKLKVLEKQLNNPISAKFVRDIRHQLSENYHSLAYEDFALGNMKSTRAYLKIAMGQEKSLKHVLLFSKTLLGRRGASLLRNLKHAASPDVDK